MNECSQGTKETVIQFTIHSTKSLPCWRLDWCTRTTTPVHQLVDPWWITHTHTLPFLHVLLPFPVSRSTRETTCMDFLVFPGISWRCIPSGSPEYPSVRRNPRSPASSSSPSSRAHTRCVTSSVAHKLKLNYIIIAWT